MGLLSFLFGCGESKSLFEQKDGAWYYHTTLIEGADAKSFQVVSVHYAKDKDRVYHGDTYRESRDYFTTKHSRVKVLDGADPATFRYLDREYARDKASVFFEGERFPVKDIDTFELLDYGHARDRIRGYYHQREVPGSDGSTFVVVDSAYSKDATRVFFSVLETRGREPVRRSMQVKGAQPGSFAALEEGYAIDAAQVYYRGALLTKEVPSFKMLQYGYAKTATQVYYSGKPVAGADAGTFTTLDRVTETADAQDRGATYQQGRQAKTP